MTPRLRLSDPLLRVQSDERLAALAGHGGERAFAILVERHRGALLAFARRLGAGAGAEDVVQQTLLQAWSALQRGARVEHVSAWMHQIARNAAIRAAAASLDSAELPATLVSPSQTADEVELRHETRRLLAEIERLPARQREALVRLAVAGSSGDEAGEAMDLEANAVRQLAFRARTRLRAAMGAAVPWPVALWAARGGGAFAGGVPELVGGAGGAGATAGLLKVGAIATTTVAVAVGAGGIAHRNRHHPAAARPHVAAAPSASTQAAGAGAPAVVSTRPASGHQERSGGGHRSEHGASGDGHSGSSDHTAVSVAPTGSSGSGSDAGSGSRDDGPSQAREPGDDNGGRTPAATEPTHTGTEHSGTGDSSHGGDGAPATSGDGGGSGSGDQHASDGSGGGSGSSGGGDATPSADDPPGDG